MRCNSGIGLGWFILRAGTILLHWMPCVAPNNLTDRNLTFISTLRWLLLDENQYVPAADELERATKLEPTNPVAHLLLGRA
jgi:hypothetical protein